MSQSNPTNIYYKIQTKKAGLADAFRYGTELKTNIDNVKYTCSPTNILVGDYTFAVFDFLKLFKHVWRKGLCMFK